MVASLTATAQDIRIGVVNVERLIRDSNSTKAAQTKLEAEFSKREKELADLGTQLKTATEKFERELPTLAESQRVSRQRQLVEQDREFQRRQREFQEDLGSRKNEEYQQALERAYKALKQVAESEKFDLVIEETAYASPKFDITDRVLKVINGGK